MSAAGLIGSAGALDGVDLSVLVLALLGVAAFLIGFAKTSIGGIALISVAIFAAVLPSRASTGIVLPLLIVGDVVAVRIYHAHADWRALLRLVPAVAVGVAAGVVFVARVDDAVMRHAIGVILVALVGIHLLHARFGAPAGDGGVRAPGRASRWGYGSLAGFTTMVANTGGPAMALYLLAAGYRVAAFLGTTAWFFFAVNVAKLPFSLGLGLITPGSMLLDAALAPLVLLGTWVGRRVITRIDQGLFERLVLVTTVAAGLNLLLR